MTHLAVYDVSLGQKISEDFPFDLNSPMARGMVPKEKEKGVGAGDIMMRYFYL